MINAVPCKHSATQKMCNKMQTLFHNFPVASLKTKKKFEVRLKLVLNSKIQKELTIKCSDKIIQKCNRKK